MSQLEKPDGSSPVPTSSYSKAPLCPEASKGKAGAVPRACPCCRASSGFDPVQEKPRGTRSSLGAAAGASCGQQGAGASRWAGRALQAPHGPSPPSRGRLAAGPCPRGLGGKISLSKLLRGFRDASLPLQHGFPLPSPEPCSPPVSACPHPCGSALRPSGLLRAGMGLGTQSQTQTGLHS